MTGREKTGKQERRMKKICGCGGEGHIYTVFVHVLCVFFLNKRTCIPHIMWMTCVYNQKCMLFNANIFVKKEK